MSRQRRVAFLLDSLRAGGVQRSTVTLAGALAERRWNVDLVTAEEGDAFAELRDPRVRVVRLEPSAELRGRIAGLKADPGGIAAFARPFLLARKPTRIAAYIGPFSRYLTTVRPDVAVAATPAVNLAAVLAKVRAGWMGKLVLTERTAPSQMLADGDNWRKRHLPGMMRRLYPRADAIVAVSQALGDDLAHVAALPRGAIRTIYNPVVPANLEALAAEPVDHPWLGPGRPPVVLGIGRLDEQKDFTTLVRGFAVLRRERPARLVILGAARLEAKTRARSDELLRTAADHGIAGDVDLPGWVDNPFAWLAKAGLFVLSSRYEGFGAVLVQAMACGCPIVATDCPAGPRELVSDGELAPLVPVGDHEALGRAMATELAQPTAAAALRARAADFTVAAAADRYEALFRELG